MLRPGTVIYSQGMMTGGEVIGMTSLLSQCKSSGFMRPYRGFCTLMKGSVPGITLNCYTMKKKKKVYTNIDGIKLSKNVDIRSYKELDEAFVEWIDQRVIDMVQKKTFAERKFASIMSEQPREILEQAFFKIGKKSYFLDFYMPDYNIAFEINGGVHANKEQERHDWNRDIDFKRIGITTIRLSNRDVYRKDIRQRLNECFKKAIKGEYDVSEFYCIPNINKYRGKMTLNQRSITLVIRKLKRVPDKMKVLIKTDMSYLVSVLNGVDTSRYENKEYLDEYYDLLKEKNLSVHVVYLGDEKKTWYMLHKKIKKVLDDINDIRFDKEIVITGEDAKKVNEKAK